MAMHWLICFIIDRAFDLPILPFVDYIESNLSKEVDFRIELENAEIAKNKLIGNEIYIPKYHKDLSSKRILVMEFINGIKITNIEELEKNKFIKKNVIHSVIQGFAD